MHDTRNRLIHFSDSVLVTEVAWQLTDVTDGLDIVETLLARTQGMDANGPINTITDHETTERAQQLVDELRVKLLTCRERYGLTPPD